MGKIERVLSFYLITNQLKDIIRSGLLTWHISKERLESVAEHVYGTCMLAIAIDSEYNFNIDIRRIVLMIAIHELEECKIGDLTPFDEVTKEKKRLEGEAAVALILKDLVKKDEYLELTREFNDKETIEAKFANYCDKLEMMLQMKINEEQGYSDMYSKENEELLSKGWIKKLIDGGSKTIADLFFDYHMKFFEGDAAFVSIAEYAQTTEITK